MSRDKILDVINAINTLETKMSVLSGANELHMAQLDSMRKYMYTKIDQEKIEMLDYVESDKLGNAQRLYKIINTVSHGRKVVNVVNAKQGAKGVEFVLEVLPHQGEVNEEYLLMTMPNELSRMSELEYYLEYLSYYTAVLLNGDIFKGKQWRERQKEAQQWEEYYDEEYGEE